MIEALNQDWFRPPQPLHHCSIGYQPRKRDWPCREGFPISKSRTQARTGWTQSEITNKYEAYDNEKEFNSLFEKTNCHRRTRSRTGALVHSKRPWRRQLQQNDVCFTRKSRTKQNPQTLRRATAVNYRILGVTPWTRPLMGPNTIHSPTDQKTVSQHPDRFWTLTCDHDSRWLQTAFDVRPLRLASSSN